MPREEIGFANRMPMAVNTSRPPSATTVPSGAGGGPGGGGAPRTTTTSRRGGRTRSRSPPVMGGRMSSDSQLPPHPPAPGENPSSAAAAAAAAAKAFSSGSGGGGGRQPSSWPEGGGGDRSRDDPGGYHRGGYHDKQPYGSNWPGEEGGRASYSRGSRYQSGPGGGYGGDNGYQGGRYSRSSEGGGRSGGYGDRPPTSSRGHHHYDGDRGQHRGRGHYPQQDYRYSSHSSGGGGDSRGVKSQRCGGSSSGTSMVIGGTTPIHVPKTSEGPPPPPAAASSRQQRGGSAASVFRGRPGDVSRPSAGPTDVDDDSPQQILLSLRTPTTSFEDKASSDSNKADKKDPTPPLSPAEPPQIQNSSQQQRSTDPVFEGQRSPEGTKPASSFETNPSFSLFNQSFDSFGDGHYFNVDSSLQNDSFGMCKSASVDQDGATQILRSTSAGNLSQQLLATGSGALTLGGYSPVNSFGNVSAPGTRRNGNILVVGGGPDPLTNSPSQVFGGGMYRSYSGGGGRGGPLDDSHLRMSVGSFGAQSMAYTKSYGGEPAGSPAAYYYNGPSRSHESSAERSPPFYSFLKRHRIAFKDCTFLLPGLKAALLETPVNEMADSNFPNQIAMDGALKTSSSGWDPTNKSGRSSSTVNPPPDSVVARRRVECSVFAFGGNPSQDGATGDSEQSQSDRSSIFRDKESVKQETATVTPTSPANRPRSRARSKYEEELPGRYYENESRLSWEFEESPPIEITYDDETDSDKTDNNQSTKNGNGEDRAKSEGDDMSSTKPSGDGHTDASGKRVSASPQPKMRYRCKLCGQPKQNHTCPYQQSLARSIGIMVFPSVNAFTATEPGTIAPALSDMNNFVDVPKETGSVDTTSHRPTPDRMLRLTGGATPTSTTQVTPESTMRSGPRPINNTPSEMKTPNRRPGGGIGSPPPPGRSGGGRKRSYAHLSGGTNEQSDLLFMESMELKPEQFRVVAPSKVTSAPGAYSYPALPLPYAQRKRLSDNLFSLSNEVPKLTDECAQVLREARERDMWDLAVAELMTQVVVIIHCSEGDNRFEGLRQYLLTLGIAC